MLPGPVIPPDPPGSNPLLVPRVDDLDPDAPVDPSPLNNPPPPDADDDDESDGEEIMYVAVDLPKGCSAPSDLTLENFRGIETHRPTITLSGKSYGGQVEMPAGTQYFWRHRGGDADPGAPDDAGGDLEYVGRIHRVIKFDE